MSISFFESSKDIPHIIGDSRDTKQSTLFIEQIIYLIDRHGLMRHEIGDDRRIDISGPGSHHHPLQWRHTHGSLNNLTILDRSYTGSITYMTRNHL